ncbi:hypothetical protein T12_15612 [Trichinella patagoniensis]|uniref:Uncharacterized protein n=1 Tax=Trichinella patagoniensis TaxID=990121 RepID=A0A0V0ZNY0_9BILA|nr:hypothetical protein T12_15612 [Trichinella patagoniensis]
MAQKNPQLCWIQKHTEEICNALFGPHKKFKLTVYQWNRHGRTNIHHDHKVKRVSIHCEFFKNALPGIDLEMEM